MSHASNGGDRIWRIFLAEDHGPDVQLLRFALDEHLNPYDLQVVPDGELAMAFVMTEVEDAVPDLVILDLNLPKHTGIEILTVLKQNDLFKRAKVVVLTSSNSAEEKRHVLELGADRFIRKPLALDDFIEIGSVLRTILLSPAATVLSE
jgi:DNA-binding response OmpR family regulator